MAEKKILLILSQSAYGNCRSKEALDIALTLAAFEQEVALLLTEDAPFLLLNGQQPESIGQKNLANSFAALPMYDVDKIYIHDHCLDKCGLSLDQLILPCISIDTLEMAQLMRDYDVVMRF